MPNKGYIEIETVDMLAHGLATTIGEVTKGVTVGYTGVAERDGSGWTYRGSAGGHAGPSDRTRLSEIVMTIVDPEPMIYPFSQTYVAKASAIGFTGSFQNGNSLWI